jgi:hypothetical protein
LGTKKNWDLHWEQKRIGTFIGNKKELGPSIWEQKRIGTFNLGTKVWDFQTLNKNVGPSIWEQECGGSFNLGTKVWDINFAIKMRDQIFWNHCILKGFRISSLIYEGSLN